MSQASSYIWPSVATLNQFNTSANSAASLGLLLIPGTVIYNPKNGHVSPLERQQSKNHNSLNHNLQSKQRLSILIMLELFSPKNC